MHSKYALTYLLNSEQFYGYFVQLIGGPKITNQLTVVIKFHSCLVPILHPTTVINIIQQWLVLFVRFNMTADLVAGNSAGASAV